MRYPTLLALLGALASAAPAAAFAAEAARPTLDRQLAVLQALDKITARTSEMTVPVGDVAAFGTLDIAVRACRSTPPDQTPEDAVFLEITDQPPGSDQATVFSGWMFASSPAVSAMEHPVYDLRLVDCTDPVGSGGTPAPDDAADPAQPLPADPPVPEQAPPAPEQAPPAPFEAPLRPVIPEEGTR